MVIAALDRPSDLLGKVTLALGGLFLAATAYLTLQQAVLSGRSGNEIESVDVLKRLSPAELTDIRRKAGEDFARDPLDADALIALSHIAEAEGRMDAAQRLKLIAGQMKPRDADVQAEAFQILLERRDFTRVMTRLDGLIRARPPESANFFALAAEIAGDPDGARAVARMLASNPPWRGAFFSYLIGKGQRDVSARLLSQLREMSAPVQPSELRALIDDLLRQNQIDAAYGVWLASLSEAEMKSVKRVYDGDFNQPVRSLRFDWTVTPGDGFSYRIFPRNTASMDQTMQLDFTNFAGRFANLSQILRLKPGRYNLTGEVRFEGFESPSALVFRFYCLEGPKPRLMEETPALPQSTQWIAFEKTFVIPESACPNQRLQLESQTKSEVAGSTRGMVALDSIAIDNLPALVP